MNIFEAVLEDNRQALLDEIDQGNINIQDESGYTALHYCAQNGKLALAKLLIDKGADVNRKDIYGNTPLFKAVFFSGGHKEMISLLLQAGADANEHNDAGVSPRELAQNIGNFDVTACFENTQ